ncbi:hypothetical protein TM48_03771 [Mycobacterium shottsii]|nr:hypothetical protein TM48_03771 [Mycobacterium shottsii]
MFGRKSVKVPGGSGRRGGTPALTRPFNKKATAQANPDHGPYPNLHEYMQNQD